MLKPYHTFDDRDGICLINVEEMRVSRIDEETSRLLEDLSADSDPSVGSASGGNLDKLGLLADRNTRSGVKGEPVLPAVSVIALFIAQTCNFNCLYCFGVGGRYGSEGEMDQSTAFRAADWLIENSPGEKKVKIAFFGGEPLLNFSLLKEVVLYGEKRSRETGKKINFSISTNGSLLDDEKNAFIKEHGIHVNVGFDGLKELQDRQRPLKNGEGSYDVTVGKVKRLLETHRDVGGRATIWNRADPVEVERTMREIGFRGVAVDVASISSSGSPNDPDGVEWIFSRMMEGAEDEAEELLETIRARDTTKLRRLQRERSGIVNRYLHSFINRIRHHFPCGAGRSYVAVDRRGDIYACHGFIGMDEHRLGNIFNGPLNRDSYRDSPGRTNEACSQCFARYICGGGCYYDNLVVSGSVSEPNGLRCCFMRRSVELLASLSSRLSHEDWDYLIKEKIIPGPPKVFDF